MAEAVPAGNVVVFFFIHHGPLFPQRKSRRIFRPPAATSPVAFRHRASFIACSPPRAPCPPQRAGSPPVQGVTPWTPAPPGGRGWQGPFPRAMLSLFSSSATAPFYRSVKPEGLPPSGGNKPGGLPPPGVLYCLQPAAHPCPPQAGSPPVQGVTPWPPWRGRGRFLRLRRSRTCPRAGSAQSGSRRW